MTDCRVFGSSVIVAGLGECSNPADVPDVTVGIEVVSGDSPDETPEQYQDPEITSVVRRGRADVGLFACPIFPYRAALSAASSTETDQPTQPENGGL